jgi:hypothetical protein
VKSISKNIMSDEIAQKVGRGGAGNYYTKADVENALHAVYIHDVLVTHEAMC